MNKQRKVLFTITYNEMGIIIDTKAEEVAQPNLQPTCNQLATDTISRQAAIDALEKWLHGLFGITEADGTVTIFKRLRELPSAEPQERKGKWIPSKYGDDTWHKCTFCGCEDKYIDIVKRPNGTIGRLESIRNYCPNCGARMEVEHETD